MEVPTTKIDEVRVITGTSIPEPIISVLFLVGGAVMGFRRFRKRAKAQ